MRRKKRMPQFGYKPKPEGNIIFNTFSQEINLLFNEEHHKYIKHGQKCPWYIANRWNPDYNFEYGHLEKNFYNELTMSRPKNTKRTVLIYGGTGHGKSCFIEHFFQSYLPRKQPQLDKDIVYLRINISSQPNPNDFEEDTDHQINDKLNELFPELKNREHYFRVWETIYDFDNDFFNDVLHDYPYDKNDIIKREWIMDRLVSPGRTSSTRWSDYNRARINYLIKQYKKHIILFFDNVDQAKKSVQNEAFRLARHKLEWIRDPAKCTVIMAVRDYMVNKAKTELPIAAFNNKPFRIYPPDIDKVIARRIRLAVENSKEKFEDATIQFPNGISITIADLEAFLKHIVRSVIHSDAKALLYEITENNVRVQLDIIYRALKNPNITIEKALEYIRSYTENETREFLVDPAELINHVMSASSEFEHSPENPLINAFDAGDHKHASNTLTIYNILSLFIDQEGWNVNNLKETIFLTGCTDYIFESAIQILLDSKLLYSEEGLDLISDEIRNLKITLSGEAFLEKFMFKLFYLEIMGYSTPLENDIYNYLPELPRNLMQKLKGVPALYHQVVRDEKFEENKFEENNCKSFKTDYRIPMLSTKIKSSALSEIKKIKSLKPEQLSEFEKCFNTMENCKYT